uniref:protein kinase domain-containing protein n=1 Tax=Streptomyces aureus TaxID=193461 RepID=UPI0006E3042D
VHRDLKPRNVMVRPDGSVVVLDLGVASVLDSDTTRLTHTGSPIGSPAYMAPEQAMGGAVGPSTDLYALGVLLHELLSGNVPFAGSTALGVLHRHLYEPPVPLRQLRPEFPEPLEALVLRLLAKDPRERPSGAHEVYERLLPLLPARGAPAGPMDPTRPFLRPHAPWPDRPAATAPAAPVAPVLPAWTPPPLPVVPAPGGDPRASYPPPVPTAPVSPAAPARADVAAAVDEVKRLLGEGALTQAVDMLGGILPAAAAEHGERSPVVRILRKQYASTLMDDGQYRRALPELRRLAADRDAEAGPADPQALQFRYDAALCLEQLGETAAALTEFRAVLPYYEGDPARAFDIRQRIALLLVATGEHAAGQEQLQRLLFDAERAFGPYHPLPAELRRVLEHQRQLGPRS